MEKIWQSLRWRSSFAYYHFLRRLKSGGNPAIAWKNPDPAAALFVSCVYEADVPLLRQCIRSLHRCNGNPPRALLVGDSPRAVAALRRAFADGGPAVEIAYWEDLAEELSPAAQKFVQAWLEGGPFGGYAKKFAVTLAAQCRGDIVMCDADVLFGGDFFALLKGLIAGENRIMAGEDYRASYDRRAAGLLGESRILEGRPLNCGVVYYPANALQRVMSDDLLTKLLPLASPPDNHLEQTLVAYAFWRAGGKFFPASMLETSLEDNLSWKNGLKAAARHYAGGKHLFWRDV